MQPNAVHVDLDQALADGVRTVSVALRPPDDVEVFLAGPVLLDDLVGQSVLLVTVPKNSERLLIELAPDLLADEVLNVPIPQERVPVAAIPVIEGRVAQVTPGKLAFQPLVTAGFVVGGFKQAGGGSTGGLRADLCDQGRFRCRGRFERGVAITLDFIHNTCIGRDATGESSRSLPLG